MSAVTAIPHLLRQAETLIREHTGRRSSTGRIRVLAALLSQQQAMTHHDVQACLTGELQMDRVTLYRTLEWLTRNGLVHKMAGDDRVWRFRANTTGNDSHQHAHFRCTRCTRLICLDNLETGTDPHLPLLTPLALPEGYRPDRVDLTVHGLCAECV